MNNKTIETYIQKLYEIGKVRNSVTLENEIRITYTYLNPDRAIFHVDELKNNYYYIVSLEFSPSNDQEPFRYIHPE